ncbi:MAG TPA: argininosuccinate lyase [Nitrospirales bacterium]|nr:argininosuccinate lyase [Nitrospirales bacterium]
MTVKRKPEQRKPWAGRFRQSTDPKVEAFTSSLAVDRRLYRQDIAGSIAHCKTLQRAGVLARREADKLIAGLTRIEREISEGRFRFAAEHEDIHMAIEARLTDIVGEIGGKLHTGRSRNDQVALDLRLYLREEIADLLVGLRRFQESLLTLAHREISVVMPGYTHLQRAQPVLFAHHLLAYVEMAERDKGRLRDALKRINVMPLGSGALAGTNYPLDREYTARLLDFPAVSQNSLDAVSDRDFVVETLAALALVMTHASRFAEELVLWSSQEFGFVELQDAFCTGSSMMPQKKNPDVPELIRAKTGRVYGHLMALLTVLKGLPLSYNRDLQEDKGPIFDAVDTVRDCLGLLASVVGGLTVRRAAMARAAASGFLLATELADYLVLKGVPFRTAHVVVGRIVRYRLDRGKDLIGISLDELRGFSPAFEKDALDVLSVEGALERKEQIGGTARKRVEARLKTLQKELRAEA